MVGFAVVGCGEVAVAVVGRLLLHPAIIYQNDYTYPGRHLRAGEGDRLSRGNPQGRVEAMTCPGVL
jgi:hypothetical protein